MKIRHKLLLSVLLSTLSVFLIIIILTYYSSRQLLLQEIENKTQNLVEANAYQLNGQFQVIQDVAEGLALSIQSGLGLSETTIDELIKTYLKSRTNAAGASVAFLPNSFSGKDYFAPTYYRNNDQLVYVDLGKGKENYAAQPWYKVPLRAKEPYLSEPFFSTIHEEMVITYAYPFWKNQKIWGVAAVDIYVTKIVEALDDISEKYGATAFLLSNNGKILSAHEEDWQFKLSIFEVAAELKSPKLAELGRKMLAGESGFESFVNPVTKGKSWFAYQPISSMGWSLVIAYPQKQVFADLAVLNIKTIIIALVGLATISFSIYLISIKITEPLRELADGVRKIAGGDFSSRLNEVSTRDEVGILTRAFNEMTQFLRTTLSRLHEEKETLRVAFSQMSDGLVILNIKGELLQSNNVAQRLLSLPNTLPFEEHLQNHFRSSLPWNKIIIAEPSQKKFVLSRKESESLGPLHLGCIISPILDEAGQLKEFIFSLRDITAQETEELSKRNFLSLISHKLFTPLTVLKGKLMLLKDGLLGELTPKQTENINDMVGQTSKLKDLIDKLVNFVTMEGAALDMTREEIDFHKFVSEVAEEQKTSFLAKEPQIYINIPAQIEKIYFNRNYLRIIIGELINNGLKFNLKKPALVRIDCSRDDDYLVIKVTDNGVGIPPEFTEHIFDKFYQVERYYTGNVEGVGLGLVHVRKLVEYFGGKIMVSSDPGQGSIFVIKLHAVF
ncbi:MAG: ATP-binding protein [Pseudomonadota bacterium]